MDPARLAVWTSIGVNYSTLQPGHQQILERYLLKFSKGGKGKLHEDMILASSSLTTQRRPTHALTSALTVTEHGVTAACVQAGNRD
eukprot:2365991-Prymnesium_polylepis.1